MLQFALLYCSSCTLLMLPLIEHLHCARSQFYDAWVHGNTGIDTDLQFALIEKSVNFNVRTDIAVLKQLADEHEIDIPKGPRVTNQEEQLRVDQLGLLIRECDNDLHLLSVWKQKCETVNSNSSSTMRRWQIEQEDSLRQGANIWMQSHILFQVLGDLAEHECSKVIIDIQAFRRNTICTSTNLQPHEVPIVCLLNWCAPSTLTELYRKNQVSILSWCMADNTDNVGLVTMPVYSNAKNKLYMSEKHALDRLLQSYLIVDHPYAVLFKEKSDGRDERPMTYPARIVFPNTLTDLHCSMWWTCQLREEGRTTPVKQLPTKLMKVIEDLSPDAVPTTDDERNVTRGHRAQQLGVDGWVAQLDGLLQRSDTKKKTTAVMFVVLSPNVGDDIEAIITKAQHMSDASLYTVALCKKQCDQDWLENEIRDVLIEKIKSKTLHVPGLPPIQDTIPGDRVLPYPDLPAFCRLVPKGKPFTSPGTQLTETGRVLPKDVSLEMPVHVYKEWSQDGVHATTFQTWMENSEVNLVTPAASVPADSNGNANKPQPEVDAQEGTQPLKKKICNNVHPKTIIDGNTITDALLFEVTLPTSKSMNQTLKLQVRHKSTYLVNVGTQTATMQSHQFLAGFGKGSFNLNKTGQKETDSANFQLEFKLEDHNTMVVMGSCVMKLQDIVQQQRKTKPQSCICYHQMDFEKDDETKFKCRQTHKVVFMAKDVNAESDAALTVNNIGAKAGQLHVWETHAMCVLWQVRWSVKGLQAMCPRVYTTKDIVLQPGQACQLWGPLGDTV